MHGSLVCRLAAFIANLTSCVVVSLCKQCVVSAAKAISDLANDNKLNINFCILHFWSRASNRVTAPIHYHSQMYDQVWSVVMGVAVQYAILFVRSNSTWSYQSWSWDWVWWWLGICRIQLTPIGHIRVKHSWRRHKQTSDDDDDNDYDDDDDDDDDEDDENDDDEDDDDDHHHFCIARFSGAAKSALQLHRTNSKESCIEQKKKKWRKIEW